MQVFRLIACAALAWCGLCLAGCGGSGGGGPSPFVGTWTGTWVSSFSTSQPQPLALTIDASGQTTGTVGPSGPEQNVVFGTTSSEGSLNINVRGTNPPANLPELSGTLYANPSGGYFAALVARVSGAPNFAVVIGITRQ